MQEILSYWIQKEISCGLEADMKTYPVAVSDGKYKCSYFAIKLRKFGLENTDREFIGSVTYPKMRQIERFCQKKHLIFRINNRYGKRSSNYRELFFSTHRPVFGNRWFCAYCGKPITVEKLTVDHLYPVGQAKNSLFVQKRMQLLGINDVNDSKNLVPSCRRCNQRKGKKMGIWILRGFVGGKYQYFWYIRWFVRLIILLLLLILIIQSY